MEEVHSDSEALVYAELSMRLQGRDTPKVFCPSKRLKVYKGRKVIVATCTSEKGHELPHVDCHTGHKWMP